jgi:hypothetical protein
MHGVKGTMGSGARPARLQRPSDQLPAFFYRLSPAAQRTYLCSDAIETFGLVPSPEALQMTAALMTTMAEGRQAAAGIIARQLADELCRLLQVRPIDIEVRGVRPHNARGELHGIFYPTRPPKIVLWMRTARRHQPVKPKTFVRTLLHEVGHYLDYALLGLGDSYHNSGFFKRESSLVRALLPESAPETARIEPKDSDRGGAA